MVRYRLSTLVAIGLTLALAPALASAQDRPLTVDFPEVYQAGGLNAPDWAQFTGRGSVSFDGSGNLYVLDSGASQVVVIGPQGRLVRTIGRAGEGPGEFGLPFRLVAWRDGRFAVQDLRHDAIQVFGPGGEFDHSVKMGTHPALTTIRPDPIGDALYAQGSSGGGSRIRSALSELMGREAEPRTDELDDFGIGRIDLNAEVVVSDLVLQAWRAPREDPPDEVSASDILDRSRMLSTMLRGATEGVFFEPTLRWDILPDGTIAYADSSAYAIKLVTPGGAAVQVLQRPIPPETVTDRLRSAAIEREIDRLTRIFVEVQGDMPDDFREKIEERGFYPEVPVILELRATWQGGLWIQRPGEDPWDTQGPIDVFGPDRQYVGTFAASTTTMPEAFGPDGLVAYWEIDELDVPSIVVKRLPEGVR